VAKGSTTAKGGKAAVLAGALAAAAGTVALLKPWEGRELVPYRDIVGIWTWCDGQTSGERKARYTQAECDAITQTEVVKVLTKVAGCVHRPLEQNEWEAIGSWAYNVGPTAACRSTLVKRINEGQPAQVWCRELLKWDRAGGRQIKGLTRRREAEYKVCIQ
jgi:lysozyme